MLVGVLISIMISIVVGVSLVPTIVDWLTELSSRKTPLSRGNLSLKGYGNPELASLYGRASVETLHGALLAKRKSSLQGNLEVNCQSIQPKIRQMHRQDFPGFLMSCRTSL